MLRSRRLGAFLTVLTVSLGLLAGVSATAANAYRAPAGAHFNVPRPWGTDAQRYKIVRTVEAAIRATRPSKKDPRPIILLTSFLFDRTATVDAAIAACRRGVSVRIILDEDGRGDEDYNGINKIQRRLISVLNGDNVTDKNHDGKADSRPRTGKCGRTSSGGTGRLTTSGSGVVMMSKTQAAASLTVPNSASVTWGKDRSYVKRCSGSCRGSGGNMHSKFYAFSHAGKTPNVVMVSSSNLNGGGANLGWNDLYVMNRVPKSFNYYKRMHRSMTDDQKAVSKVYAIKDGRYTSRFYPIPHAGKNSDPTLADLRKVSCSSAFGPTKIYVSMFFWAGTRGNYMLDRLLYMADQGCKVNVIVGAPSNQVLNRIVAASKSGRINAFDSRWNWNADSPTDEGPDVRTHGKYVLVKGTYAGKRKSYQVWTGTGNWVGGSLHLGDENSLNISRKSAYNKYVANWNTVRNHSRHLPQAPGSSCPRCSD